MAQLVKCQLCKHEDLILDSQHPLNTNKQTKTNQNRRYENKQTNKQKTPNRC